MRHTLLIVALISLVVPSAASTWYAGGTHEPDTSYDTAAWMFQEPPPVGSNRIYFNGITFSGTTTSVSPNVALLEMQNEPPASERHMALLGVWKDCNGDGYIGAAEQALREYPASLLLTGSTCPGVTGPASAWVPGAHNYNGWVSEFIFIGRTGTQRIYTDADAMVWGDYHRPDEKPTFRSCALTPFPRGTTQSTGGALAYAECRMEQRIGFEFMENFNAVVDAVGDPLGLRFEDESDPFSSPVGQVQTFGSDAGENTPVYVWDCEAGSTTVGPARVYSPDPRAGNADPTKWTIPAFYNTTTEGMYPDNCDPSDDRAGGFYQEDDFLGIDPNNKTQADWNFQFAAGGRGGPGAGHVGGAGAAGAANDLGVGWGGHTGWYGDSLYLSKTGPNLVRASLSSVSFSGAYWLTFYASVGTATNARGFEKTVGTGEYGSWHCGDETSGIHNGWNCDPSTWYLNLDGTSVTPPYPYAFPGQPYQFRDVDCYDGSNAVGVATGGPAYGPDPCT